MAEKMTDKKTDKNEIVKGKNSKTRIIKFAIIFILICLFFVFCYFQNNTLMVTNYQYKTDKLSADFEKVRIVQISDLHNAVFGKDNEKLLSKIQELNPDFIVFTGDMVDSNHTDINSIISFSAKAVNIAPVYYVTGNHEYWLSDENYERLMEGLTNAGVNLLQNQKVLLDKNIDSEGAKDRSLGEYISLIGLDDRNLDEYTLTPLIDESEFSIVLAHEPQKIDVYANAKADLVLTGHAHGGQFRLPIIGPIIAPDQGLFPKYTSGEYYQDNTEMLVSRGLGNSVIPVRLFNYPEIVCIDIAGLMK